MPVRTAYPRHDTLSDHERKNLTILDLVRREGPIARTEVSRVTEQNIVTVSSYVDEFIRKGLLIETGLDVSSGGRRPTLVDFGPNAGYVVGAGLTGSHILATVVSLKGKVVYHVKRDRPSQTNVGLVDKVVDLTEETIKRCKVDQRLIKGIGLGIPGIVDEERRTVRWPQGLGQPDVIIDIFLRDLFGERFKLPFLVSNDADCAVFGEHWFELPTEVKHLVYMYSGVACGITINGQIYYGTSGFAGELGIFNPEEADPKTWLEQSYGLGRWSIELGMLEQARALWDSDTKRSSKLFELAHHDPNQITLETITEALKMDDPLTIELVCNAGVALGKKIAFLVNLLNPQMVIVGGGLEVLGSVFLDAVKRTVKAWALEEASDGLTLTYARLGEGAVPLGAGALMTQELFIKG